MRTWQALTIGVLIGLLAGGGIVLVATPRPKASIEYLAPTQSTTVIVSVTGAVNQPGLYSLSAGARTNDALAAAGGTTVNADLDQVNLAAPLEDGEQIDIPDLANEDTPATIQTQGKINVNQATQIELETLPGIGSEKAQTLIAYREEHGNFSTIDDLLYVPGFGPVLVDSLRNLIDVK